MNAPPDPIPVRMVNEYAYCPRLFHLMYVGERWDSNAYTDEGRSLHRRTDAADDPLPAPIETGEEPPAVARSVSLGLSGKLDLLETDGATATPVDTKRGGVIRDAAPLKHCRFSLSVFAFLKPLVDGPQDGRFAGICQPFGLPNAGKMV